MLERILQLAYSRGNITEVAKGDRIRPKKCLTYCSNEDHRGNMARQTEQTRKIPIVVQFARPPRQVSVQIA